MTHNGIAERKQSSELAKILSLAFSSAHRKLNGETPWTVAQIKQVAAHYKVRPAALLASLAEAGEEPGRADAREAVLAVGNCEFTCLAWIGNRLPNGQSAELVACLQDGKWHVSVPSSGADSRDCHVVAKLEIHPRQIGKLSIAVIDDEADTADNLSDFLNESGFNCTAFYSTDSAAASMREKVFDGFVVDWIVGKQTGEGLIRSIRQSGNPDVPIILLTGELSTGKVDENEVAQLVRRFNVFCHEKPAKCSIIAAELSKALGLH